MEFLKKLEEILIERKKELPNGSYTSRLFQEGEDTILKKVMEESGEFLIAIKNGKKEEIIHEASDLIFHLMVALVEKDIYLNDILDELKKRHKKK